MILLDILKFEKGSLSTLLLLLLFHCENRLHESCCQCCLNNIQDFLYILRGLYFHQLVKSIEKTRVFRFVDSLLLAHTYNISIIKILDTFITEKVLCEPSFIL